MIACDFQEAQIIWKSLPQQRCMKRDTNSLENCLIYHINMAKLETGAQRFELAVLFDQLQWIESLPVFEYAEMKMRSRALPCVARAADRGRLRDLGALPDTDFA